MKFDTNSDMEQEEEALYYYSSNKNEIFQTQDDTLFIKPGITAYNLRVSVSTHIGKVRGNHEDNFYLEGLRLNEIFRNECGLLTKLSQNLSQKPTILSVICCEKKIA